MDGLKTLVANIADLADRQLALLVDTRYNNGLPSNLSGAPADKLAIPPPYEAADGVFIPSGCRGGRRRGAQ